MQTELKDQTAGDTTSQSQGTTPTNQTLSTTSGTMVSGSLLSADNDLIGYVDEMLKTDKRFKGMSRYIYDINFYWSKDIETACAGHGFIFFNPDWWDKMAHEERKTVIAHEIYHLVCNHLQRGMDKDPESYALAIDHVVNHACNDDGFLTKLTPGGSPTDFGGMGMVIDPKFHGMGSDKIYGIIHEERKKDPKSHAPSGAPSKDQIEDMVKQALQQQGSGKDLKQQAEENAQKADEAMEDSQKMAGKGAGGTPTILRTEGLKIHVKKATYQEIFEDYLTDPLSGGKRTYLRPSRRQMRGDLRLKGKYPKRGKKNRLTHLVYALDVSGSITSHQKKQFLASANTLKEKLNPALMTVLLWDDGIRYEKTYREDEKLDNIRVMSGGGTNLGPVYQRVKQLMPEALVIFTDLCVQIPPKPDWETIWFVPDEDIHEHYANKVTYGDIYLIPED